MYHQRNISGTSEPEDTLGTDTNTVKSPISKRVAHPVNRVDKSGYTSLPDAARDNAYEAAAILLESGADVNATDKYGYPPLHWGGVAQCL